MTKTNGYSMREKKVVDYNVLRRKSFYDFLFILKAVFIRDSWQSVRKTDVLLYSHDGNAGYCYNKMAYSPLLHSFGDKLNSLGLRCRGIAAPFSHLTGEKSHFNPIAVNRFFIKVKLIVPLISICFGKNSAKQWSKNCKKRFWNRLLKQTEAKVILSIGMDESLIEACKESNVSFYEVQHGVIIDNDDIIPKLRNLAGNGSALPTGILVWDEETREELSKLSIHDLDIKVTGNPWLNRYVFPESSDCIVAYAIKLFSTFKLTNNGKPTILITLQWGLKRLFNVKNNVMLDSLEQTIMETAKEYNWLIKIHPVSCRSHEEKQIISYLTSKFSMLENVEWSITSKTPLPLLLNIINMHITYNSSTILEASWLNIPSAALAPFLKAGEPWSNCFAKARDLGLLEILPDSVDAIKKWIHNNTLKNRCKNYDLLRKNNSNLNYFYQYIFDKIKGAKL